MVTLYVNEGKYYGDEVQSVKKPVCLEREIVMSSGPILVFISGENLYLHRI